MTARPTTTEETPDDRHRAPPPEQAAITALGRHIRAEVARIHAADPVTGSAFPLHLKEAS